MTSTTASPIETRPVSSPLRWLDLQRRRHESRERYADYQFQSARGRVAGIARELHLAAPRVLDVGCGLGGLTTAYALDGARAVGIDVELYDRDSLAFARAFARAHDADATFLPVPDDRWPLRSACFDLVFLDSVLEHTVDPARILAESARVLKPGGRAYVSFPLFYGPFGGHIDDYIRVPWFHLLPRRLVAGTLRRCRPIGAYVTPAFVEGLYASLNRLTMGRFVRLARAAGLDVVRLDRSAYLTTAGNQLAADLRAALRRRDRRAAWRAVARARADFGAGEFVLFVVLALCLPLGRIPFVQECVLGGLRATLVKPVAPHAEPR
jgi:SAM-dependent methyltransferase